MGKNKKITHSKKEEVQARRTIQVVFASLVVLALILLISFSFFG